MRYFRALVLTALLSITVLPAYAAITATHELVAEPEPALLARIPEQRERVTLQLIERGVAPDDAIQRTRQMTDQQILALQGQIDELPAAAGMDTTNLLLLIIIIILIL